MDHKLTTNDLYNKEIILSMTHSVKEKIRASNSNNTKGDMDLKIITMITSPNEKWKLEERNTWSVRDNDNI